MLRFLSIFFSPKLGRSLIVFLFFAAICFLPSMLFAKDEATKGNSQQIVAEVNGQKISNQILEEELNRHFAGRLESFSKPQANHLRKQLLQKMIERELLHQAAVKAKKEPSATEVDGYVNNITTNLGSHEALIAALKQKNLTEDNFRHQIQIDLAVKSYIEDVILKDVLVSDTDLRNAFDTDPQQFARPEEVKARHILFKIPAGADQALQEEVRERADKVLASVKAGSTPFTELAKQHSEGPTKARGGDLGYFSRKQMVPEFEKAAFALQPKQTSDLVRTKFGYHIILVENRRGGEAPVFEEEKENIRQLLLQKKQRDTVSTHIQGLRTKGKVIVYID